MYDHNRFIETDMDYKINANLGTPIYMLADMLNKPIKICDAIRTLETLKAYSTHILFDVTLGGEVFVTTAPLGKKGIIYTHVPVDDLFAKNEGGH